MDHSYIEKNNIADHYLMRKLSAEESEQFELHFLDCDECFKLVEEIQEVRELLSEIDPTRIAGAELPASKYSPAILTWLIPWRPAAVLPAALLILALATLLYFIIDNRRLREELNRLRAAQVSLPQESAPEEERTQPAPGQQPAPSPDEPTRAQSDNPPRAASPAPGSLTGAGQSQINMPIFTLIAVRGGEPQDNAEVINKIEVPRSPGWFVISLHLEGKRKYESYRASIKSGDKVKWRRSGLLPNSYGALALGFHSTLFQPGDYVLNLEGVNRGRPEPVATYPFRIVKE
ncbi:MAG TPA: hypothetical protein VF131_01830 [Blastocatellia bacterium]|nr:hypothetical protein [Blastocatellia bacterium]